MERWAAQSVLTAVLLALVGACGPRALSVEEQANATAVAVRTRVALELGPEPTPVPTPVPTPTPVPSPTPVVCSTNDGRKAYDLLKQHGTEWTDAVTLAGSTPRVQLAPQIATLQRIRRDVQAQPWPECAQRAQALLVTTMNGIIDGLTDFLGQRPGYESKIEASTRTMAEFNAELERVVR
jgi:hypothetical protein